MTPIKESAEVPSAPAASESSQTKARPKTESPHLRADAVSLDVPVKAHGSLLPSVSPGAGPGGIGQAQPFEEQTSTMIVFPQGSVLKMSTAVSAGQVMVLTNLKSRQDAICRVVKVRAYGAGQSYVEIEFTSPQPGYWGVYFPSDGPDVARMPQQQQQPRADPMTAAQDSPAPSATSVPPAATQAIEQPILQSSSPAPMVVPPPAKPAEPAPVSAGVQQSPVVPPRPPVAAKLPESSFASIGTKEDVLASAEATREPRASLSTDASAKHSPIADREIGEAIDALIAPAAKTIVMPRAEARESGAAATLAAKPMEAHKSAAETRLPAPKQMFGVTLDSATPEAEKPSREGGSKLWIGVGIAAVIAIAAGAAYYFRFLPASSRNLSTAPAAASVSAPAAQPSDAQLSLTQTPAGNVAAAQAASDQAASQPAAMQSPDVASAETRSGAADRSSFAAVDSSPRRRDLDSKREIPAKPQPNVAIPSAFGVLNTRPVVASHAGTASAGAAPALNASAGPIEPNGSLPAIAPPPPSAPAAPKPVSNAPVRVGGKVLPPRLVSSVLPMYPQIAQQANVTGTVVIDTTVDKQGNVAKMKVISGPELLRAAALSALRQWKYEPSRLDGQPISVEMVVSIRFH